MEERLSWIPETHTLADPHAEPPPPESVLATHDLADSVLALVIRPRPDATPTLGRLVRYRGRAAEVLRSSCRRSP